jgi:hypothetical protein
MLIKERSGYFAIKIMAMCLLLSLVFLSLSSCKPPAKPEPAIAGVYNTSSGGDPQGGGGLYILPDHRFVMLFFGGAAMGTWEISDTTVLFKPQFKPTGFRLYGRRNTKLGDSIRIYFEGFDTFGTAAIGFNAPAKTVKQVFNDSPNCTEYPTVGKFKGIPQNIVLAARTVDENGRLAANPDWYIYTCNNPDKHNDFIALYNPETNHPRLQDFRGSIHNGKLNFAQKSSEKKPLPGASEMKAIYQLLNMPMDPESAYYNPYYKEAMAGVEKDTLNYKFNSGKGAYINFQNYKEGEENKPVKDGDYNNMNVIYRYRKLNYTTTSGPVKLDAKPIFTAKCKEE